MINLLLNGCNGKMGQVISRLIYKFQNMQIVAGVSRNNSIKNSFKTYTNITECKEKIDVIIDFSNPNAFEGLLNFATSKKIPIVVATTGLSEQQIKRLKEYSKEIPIFFTANMSLGINLLLELVTKASKVLQDNFDIEIIEKHHNQKLDAPSGTAIMIANTINNELDEPRGYVYDRHLLREKRGNEIGIHSIRGGNIVGEHSVIFAGNDEVIEIKHSAASKEVFATGALNAARFLYCKQPGLYSMKDLIGTVI